MAHIITKPEFINQYLNGFTIQSLEDLQLWVTRKTVSLSPEFDSVVDEAMDKIVGSYQQLGESQVQLFGRKLGDYSGFSHAQLQSVFGLTSEQATEVQNALGVS